MTKTKTCPICGHILKRNMYDEYCCNKLVYSVLFHELSPHYCESKDYINLYIDNNDTIIYIYLDSNKEYESFFYNDKNGDYIPFITSHLKKDESIKHLIKKLIILSKFS